MNPTWNLQNCTLGNTSALQFLDGKINAGIFIDFIGYWVFHKHLKVYCTYIVRCILYIYREMYLIVNGSGRLSGNLSCLHVRMSSADFPYVMHLELKLQGEKQGVLGWWRVTKGIESGAAAQLRGLCFSVFYSMRSSLIWILSWVHTSNFFHHIPNLCRKFTSNVLQSLHDM